MSIAAMSIVWERERPKGSKRLVLLALADAANNQGTCWPSYETIARHAGISRRHTIDLIKELEAEGELQVLRRHRGKRNTSCLYKILCVSQMHSRLGGGGGEPSSLPPHQEAESSPGSEPASSPGSEPASSPRTVRDPSGIHDLSPSKEEERRLDVLEWAVAGGHAVFCRGTDHREVEFFEDEDGRLMFKGVGLPETYGVAVDECPGVLRPLVSAGFCDPEEAPCSTK